jgi:hypothetical protein
MRFSIFFTARSMTPEDDEPITGSLHHPVRFVERMNLLDQLTRGRLLVGLAR